MRYFYPNGDEIDNLDKFVDFYEQVYFYAYNKFRLIEKHIESLLESQHELTGEDIEALLVWKTGGKIKDGCVQPPYGKKISLDLVKKALVDGSGKKKQLQYCGCWDKDKTKIQELVNILVGSYPDYKDGVSGIGPVYALTCLYFLSNGKYPIYDKFAHLGLIAVTMDDAFEVAKESGNVVRLPKSLLDELKKQFGSHRKGWLDEYYENFFSVLMDCGLWDKYSENRSLDRALWAYGHLFGYDSKNAR